ncbi:rap guanine nucleotide exchange factor 1 isoform X8 [Penaeus vannamei]|uniref:rap guanine nucleotide exchange factor 1 isoform X8 n=1 Tax=Penaeus vannamei TaxID=6689 RepID=UPI00387FACE1
MKSRLHHQTRHLLARKMATRRKMSMSSLLGDVRKKVGRKMTIHDPSSVASLVGSLTHLRVLEEDARRGRASSEPPATVPDTHSDCSSDEKELEDDTAMEPEHEEDDDSDDDEFYIAYLMEMQEGDGSFMNGKDQIVCCPGSPDCSPGRYVRNGSRWRCYHDTPKPSKGGVFLSRAYSVKEKLKGMKSPMRSTGKIVKVEPSHSSESLESKVEHVWRALAFYRDVVEKSMMDMLPGSATVVLEMVLALNLALKPCFSNQNSSAVSSVIARVHHSVAELVRWSDQLLLRGDEAHNTQTVQQVVQTVRDAVQAFVDLAADKENLNISDSSIMDSSPSTNVNNNSINSEISTPYYRNSDTVSNHRNSLPEITADSPVEKNRSFLSPRDSSTKLSHSLSSDSILNTTVEAPPPKPPLPTGRNDIAPPLPPKKKNHCKRSSPENGVGNPMYQNSPLGHSSPLNRSPRESSSEWPPHGCGSGPYTGSLDRESHTAHSSDQVSPASSLDSMNQSHEESVKSQTSLNPCGSILSDRLDLNFERALQNIVIEPRLGHCLSDFDTASMCFTDSGFPSLSSVNSLSSNTLINSSTNQPFLSHMSKSTSESQSVVESRTETFFSSSSQVSSKVSCSTKRVVSYQHFTTTRSSTSSSVSSASTSSSGSEVGLQVNEGEKIENNTMSIQVPPALPVKQRIQQGRRSAEMRTASTYDNVNCDFPDTDTVDSHDIRYKKDDPSPKLPPKIGNLQLGGSSSSSTSSVNSGYMSSTTSMLSNSSNASSQGSSSVVQLRRHTTVFQSQLGSSGLGDDNPPPLPVKKKYVMDYMKLFGQVSEPNESDLLRNSVHQIHLHADWHAHESEHELYHASHSFSSMMQGSMEHISLQPPPALPPKQKQRAIASVSRQSLPPAMRVVPIMGPEPEEKAYDPMDNGRKHEEERDEPEEVIVQDQCLHIEKKVPEKEEEEEEEEECLLDYLDVQEYLVLKKEGDEGPDIRGGPVDALVVHASKANKNDFLYQEAFLTTYRTFVSPSELVTKLLYRYNKFTNSPDVDHQKAARNAFSLLVRVVDELTITDLNIELLETLTEFEYYLLCCGDLLLARALRKKIVEKLEKRKRYYAPNESLIIASREVTTKQSTILEFKSQDIAEQMTLLDAELFHNMEIPEVLLWAREQNEERSPNLTTFTEHFNKMSYWARSRILEQEDAKDREKYVMKFIKIMKHLRKISNFNSYLALLSALDSAPIRRLEWQRNVTDGLKEYCALIDSSCSFRAYRQALSDSTPPCIPYIGLILQDLTFVDIGNNELMSDGNVNFSKRWQQFNILDNMKRFKKCQYSFKKNEKVIAFFNNFDDYHSEEALWHISESIKPRGGKKK